MLTYFRNLSMRTSTNLFIFTLASADIITLLSGTDRSPPVPGLTKVLQTKEQHLTCLSTGTNTHSHSVNQSAGLELFYQRCKFRCVIYQSFRNKIRKKLCYPTLLYSQSLIMLKI